jgi:hypothetical protein
VMIRCWLDVHGGRSSREYVRSEYHCIQFEII